MQSISRTAIAFGMSFSLVYPAMADELKFVWEMPNAFKNPESTVYDQTRELIYVSNINGEPAEKNGNGFISVVSLDGELTQPEWLSGLDAPKGMTIVGNKLYVSDITALVEIDLETSEVSNRYDVADAEFLNDVTSDAAGDVYVSDMFTNTIHRLSEGKLDVWVNDERLENPNGLLIDGERLIVASWGKMNADFSTEIPGRLQQIDIASKAISNLGNGKPIGNLDGLQPDGNGSYYVTDSVAGKLLRINEKGHAKKLLKMCRSVADLEYIAEKQLLVIPITKENAVVAFRSEK